MNSIYKTIAREDTKKTEKETGNVIPKQARDNLINRLSEMYQKNDDHSERILLNRFKEIGNTAKARLDKWHSDNQILLSDQRKNLLSLSSISLVIIGIGMPLLYQQLNTIKDMNLFLIGGAGLFAVAIISAIISWYDIKLSLKATESTNIYYSIDDEYNRQQAIKLHNIVLINKQREYKIKDEINDPLKTQEFEDMKKFTNKYYKLYNKVGLIYILFFFSIGIIVLSFLIQIEDII